MQPKKSPQTKSKRREGYMLMTSSNPLEKESLTSGIMINTEQPESMLAKRISKTPKTFGLKTTGTKKNDLGFKQLRYKGLPVIVRNDVPDGVLYFMNGEVPLQDFDVVWSMREMANRIEGKPTWPSAKIIWKFKQRRFGKLKNV